jgi:diguanylate cyclase (GGDEF)-like protein
MGVPRLAEALHELLYRADQAPSELDAALRGLVSVHGGDVYSELLFLLSHLNFEPGDAERYWREILVHHQSLERRLGSFVDLRVALASYFLQVNRKLENPKMIELRLFEATQASAYRDELTGLYNYRFFTESLRCEIATARRIDAPLSLVMADVDDFKRYNDRHGHEVGNAGLREFAELLVTQVHEAGIATRYGGEEFALILPSTPKQDALLLAERIRAAIEEHEFPERDAHRGAVLTASLGLATFPADAEEIGDLIRCADRALYAAKEAGKNRVQPFGRSLRSFARVSAAVPGSFQRLDGDPLPLTCLNLSPGGLCFLTAHPPELDALLELSLELPLPHGHVSLVGRVVQLLPSAPSRQLVGCRILHIEPEDRRRLDGHLRQLATGAFPPGSPTEDGSPRRSSGRR